MFVKSDLEALDQSLQKTDYPTVTREGKTLYIGTVDGVYAVKLFEPEWVSFEEEHPSYE